MRCLRDSRSQELYPEICQRWTTTAFNCDSHSSSGKTNAVLEQITAVRESQAVTSPSEQVSVFSMNIDTESDQVFKKSADFQNNTDSQKEDLPIHNSILMLNSRGLLNLIGLYLEEIKSECLGAWSSFLAPISDGVSRAVRIDKIFLKATNDIHNLNIISAKTKNTWVSRAANASNRTNDYPTRAPNLRPTPLRGPEGYDST